MTTNRLPQVPSQLLAPILPSVIRNAVGGGGYAGAAVQVVPTPAFLNWLNAIQNISAVGGTPASPSHAVQINNVGVFGGYANFTWTLTGANDGVSYSLNLSDAYPVIDQTGMVFSGADTSSAFLFTGSVTGSSTNHARGWNNIFTVGGSITYDMAAYNITNIGTGEAGALIGAITVDHGGNAFAIDHFNIVPLGSVNGNLTQTTGMRVVLDRHVAASGGGFDRGYVVENAGSVKGSGAAFSADGFATGLQLLDGVGGDMVDYVLTRGAAADYNVLHSSRAGATDVVLKTYGQGYKVASGNGSFSPVANLYVDGALVLSAPGSAVAGAVTADSNYSMVFRGLTASPVVGDFAWLSAAGTVRKYIATDGGQVNGTATGGSQGVGTINAQGLYVNGVAVAAGSGDNWVVKSANYTAVARDAVMADMSGGAWTFQFPASPSVGTFVSAYAFGANDLTLDRNGQNIKGVAANWTFKDGDGARFVFMNASNGWEPTGRQYG